LRSHVERKGSDTVTLDDFRATLADGSAPAVTPLLKALWHDAKGDWDRAHQIAQDIETPEAAWVHAYLHRREGDISNARYWYRRAGQPEATDALESEWARIVGHLLD
jgi:hypothetical protein